MDHDLGVPIKECHSPLSSTRIKSLVADLQQTLKRIQGRDQE